MSFWQAVIVATIPSLAALPAAWIGLRDLRLRRRIETSNQFLRMIAIAHDHPADGRTHTAIFEQIAAVHLIADLAAQEPVLRNAALADSRGLAEWTATESSVHSIADGPSREQVFKRTLGEAAQSALQRLDPKPYRSATPPHP